MAGQPSFFSTWPGLGLRAAPDLARRSSTKRRGQEEGDIHLSLTHVMYTRHLPATSCLPALLYSTSLPPSPYSWHPELPHPAFHSFQMAEPQGGPRLGPFCPAPGVARSQGSEQKGAGIHSGLQLSPIPEPQVISAPS